MTTEKINVPLTITTSVESGILRLDIDMRRSIAMIPDLPLVEQCAKVTARWRYGTKEDMELEIQRLEEMIKDRRFPTMVSAMEERGQ